MCGNAVTVDVVKAIAERFFLNKTDSTGMVRAMYVQIYNGQEQVLDSKSYKSLKMAEKWAKKKLN